MARQRRGGGFRASELPLRGTLGTLLRTAAAQVGPLRDALERTAREGLREGRERLDDALAARASRTPATTRGGRRRVSAADDDERATALADLGATVLDLIRQGEIDLAELPEVRDIIAHLDALDDDANHPDEDDEELPAPPSRNRFDSRRRDPGRSAAAPSRNEEDGTVSSKTWRPAAAAVGRSSLAPAKKPPARVWRPPVEDVQDDRRPADEVTARARPVPKPKDPLRKGGISFEDDDDLAEYMHPDDVPPKSPKDGDS